MKYIDIGKSGMKASAISLGCMRIPSLSEKELENHVKTALECGVNHFDHANIYGGGNCEKLFGDLLSKDKSLREKMIIQSKCAIRNGQYDFSKEHILESVDGILSRLGVEYLDTLLLHRPDALMEPEEVAEAFDTLEKAGKGKTFGISNFNTLQTKLLQASLKQKLIVNQLQFSVMHTGLIDMGICTNTKFAGSVDRDGSVLDYCRLKDITVQAWSPFQFGFFEGTFIDNDKFPELNKALAECGEKHGVSKTTIATAWILRHPAKMQVIAGTTNQNRLKEICAAADIEISREDWYKIYLSAGNELP